VHTTNAVIGADLPAFRGQ